MKLQRAVEEVKKLLIPADGEDELKKRQLMELAIINGTYRDSNAKVAAVAGTCTVPFHLYSRDRIVHFNFFVVVSMRRGMEKTGIGSGRNATTVIACHARFRHAAQVPGDAFGRPTHNLASFAGTDDGGVFT